MKRGHFSAKKTFGKKASLIVINCFGTLEAIKPVIQTKGVTTLARMCQINLITKLWCTTNKDKLSTRCLTGDFYSCAECLRSKKHMKVIDQHIYPVHDGVTDCRCTRTICYISRLLDMCGNRAVFHLSFGSQDSLNVEWWKHGVVCHQSLYLNLLPVLMLYCYNCNWLNYRFKRS